MKILIGTILFIVTTSIYAETHVCESYDDIEDENGKDLVDLGYCVATEVAQTYVGGGVITDKKTGNPKMKTVYIGTSKLDQLTQSKSPGSGKDFFTVPTCYTIFGCASAEDLFRESLRAKQNDARSESVVKLQGDLVTAKQEVSETIASHEQLNRDIMAGLSKEESLDVFKCEKSEASDCLKDKEKFEQEKRNKDKQSNEAKQKQLAESNAKIESAKKQKEEQVEKISLAIKGLDEQYKGKFRDLALSDLKKLDPNITSNNLEQICSGSITKTQFKDNEDETKNNRVRDECKKIQVQGRLVSGIHDRLEGLKTDMEKSNMLDMLKMTVGLEGLNLEQKKIELETIRGTAREKLKGTVLGHMMDEMREDMCNVAQNHNVLCKGTSYAFEKLIDDSSEVTKQAVKEFENRKISSQAIKD